MYSLVACNWTLKTPKIRIDKKTSQRRKSNSNLPINSKKNRNRSKLCSPEWYSAMSHCWISALLINIRISLTLAALRLFRALSSSTKQSRSWPELCSCQKTPQLPSSPPLVTRPPSYVTNTLRLLQHALFETRSTMLLPFSLSDTSTGRALDPSTLKKIGTIGPSSCLPCAVLPHILFLTFTESVTS